jgi:predicted ATP-grasp superfamily ATP-dependent carboligase
MFTTRKLRQWLPNTGEGSLSEEYRDENVVRITEQLFSSVYYYGLGYVEVKRDAEKGSYFILEPNIGRPTGRSATAEASGVDLLYTMYCDAVGLPLPDNRTQTFQGVKWVHIVRDLQAVFYHWRRGELTLREWIRSWRGRKTYPIFSWHDPAPFLYYLLRSFLKLFGKGT